MTIPNTILQQLGGSRFLAMTGARDLVADGAALQFKLPRGFARDGINFVRIELGADDLYTLTLSRYSAARLELRQIALHGGVYADRLRAIFTEATGLDTSL